MINPKCIIYILYVISNYHIISSVKRLDHFHYLPKKVTSKKGIYHLETIAFL